jgi:hypothetical protein
MKKFLRASLPALYLCALFAVAGAFDKLLGFEPEEASPKFVIEGVKTEDYDDVMSGIFLGWVNKNAALMAGARIGAGRAVSRRFAWPELTARTNTRGACSTR